MLNKLNDLEAKFLETRSLDAEVDLLLAMKEEGLLSEEELDLLTLADHPASIAAFGNFKVPYKKWMLNNWMHSVHHRDKNIARHCLMAAVRLAVQQLTSGQKEKGQQVLDLMDDIENQMTSRTGAEEKTNFLLKLKELKDQDPAAIQLATYICIGATYASLPASGSNMKYVKQAMEEADKRKPSYREKPKKKKRQLEKGDIRLRIRKVMEEEIILQILGKDHIRTEQELADIEEQAVMAQRVRKLFKDLSKPRL